MATQMERLLGRLRNDRFRENFLAKCNDAMSMACSFINGDLDDPSYEDLKDDWEASLEFAMEVNGGIPDTLEKPVESLSSPKIVAPGELWDEFEVYLRTECYGVSEESYEAYLDHVEHRLLRSRQSDPFELCSIVFPEGNEILDHAIRGIAHGTLVTRAQILGNVSKEEIKNSADQLFKEEHETMPRVLGHINEFEITFHSVQFNETQRGLRKPDPDERKFGKVYVQVSGHASAHAMDALIHELRPLAQSQFRSVQCLESEPNPEIFRKYLVFGMKGIELAVLNTSNEDTFQRRIANAVRLLAEADKQSSDPIGLSLCVTAIDALLGKKGSEMTTQLADAVACLLEPEVSLRRRAADYVKDLYDKRSRILHGDRIEGDSELRGKARRLAASVLFGVWSYQDFFERFYADTAMLDDFFKKLRENFVNAGLQEGVLELPIRQLWKDEPQEH